MTCAFHSRVANEGYFPDIAPHRHLAFAKQCKILSTIIGLCLGSFLELLTLLSA